MRRIKCIATWGLGVLFTGLMVWWSLYTPYKPELVFKAIPGEAAFVSAHENLGERWDDFSGNPLTRSLFTSLGVRQEDLAALGSDPESKKWLQTLAGRKVALAYVPEMGFSRRPAWVAASWLGGQSQYLRWQLTWAQLRDFRRLEGSRGHPIWLVRSPFLEKGTILTISLVEGMLVACLSRSPMDIRYLLDAYDGYRPSLLDQEPFLEAFQPYSEPASKDSGWASLHEMNARMKEPPGELAYALSTLTRNSIAGALRSPTPSPRLTNLPAALSAKGLDRLWGGLPVALAAAGRQIALNTLLEPTAAAWIKQAGRIVEEQPGAAVYLGIFGDAYSGRFKGLKIPTLMAAIQSQEPEAALHSIRLGLDRINAINRWGLILRPFQAAGHDVFAIEATGKSPLSLMTIEECPAFTVCGGWLVFSSNLDALLKLVERYERVEATDEAAQTPWIGRISSSTAPIQAWIDLDRGSTTLRKAVATWSLKMLLENPAGSQRLRQRLNEAKAWIDAIAPLKSGCAQISSDEKETVLLFEMGAPAK